MALTLAKAELLKLSIGRHARAKKAAKNILKH
jgi:hypothetical protein